MFGSKVTYKCDGMFRGILRVHVRVAKVEPSRSHHVGELEGGFFAQKLMHESFLKGIGDKADGIRVEANADIASKFATSGCRSEAIHESWRPVMVLGTVWCKRPFCLCGTA